MELQEFYILHDYTYSFITTNILKESNIHILFNKFGQSSLRLSRLSALTLFYLKPHLGAFLDQLNRSETTSGRFCLGREVHTEFYFVVTKFWNQAGVLSHIYQIETRNPITSSVEFYSFSKYEIDLFYLNRPLFEFALYQWDIILHILHHETQAGSRVHPLTLKQECKRALLKQLPRNRFLSLSVINPLSDKMKDFLRCWDEGHFAISGIWYPLNV